MTTREMAIAARRRLADLEELDRLRVLAVQAETDQAELGCRAWKARQAVREAECALGVS